MADAGLRIVVEGEKDFKAALSQIDAQLKINRSELRLLSEEYKLNGDSLEGLTDKQKALDAAAETQRQKVALLNNEYKKAADIYGEQDERVLKLKGTLLDASATLAKMTKSAQDNAKALDESRETLEKQQAGAAAYAESVGKLDQRIREFDDGIAENKETLKDLAAKYGALGDSSDALQAKQKNLRKQGETLSDSIEAQGRKIDELNRGLKKSEGLYGQNSAEADAYRKRIADATEELEDMRDALDDNNTALADVSEEGGGKLFDILGKISEKTGIEIPEGILSMAGGMGDVTLATEGFIGALAAGGIKLASMQKDMADWADELTTKSQVMDIGTEQYQALEYAAAKVGVSMDDIDDALNEIRNKAGETDDVIGKWVGRMGELKNASEEDQKAVAEAMKEWDRFGVALYDSSGNIRDAKDILYDMLDVLGDMPDDSERAHLAMELFGDEARRLNPLIEAGTGNLKRFEQEAYDTGVVLDKDVIAKFDAASNGFATFKLRIDAAKRSLVADMSETNVFDWLWKSFKQFIPFAGFFDFLKGVRDIGGMLTGAPVPKYAAGTNYHPGGLALVGEGGPELVSLPRGARVHPNGTAPVAGGNVWNITISAANVKEFNDIIRIAQNQVRDTRMGYVRG